MKPLINSPAGLRALEEMVRTMPYYPPGLLLFESEEPKTMLIKGEVPLLFSWTSTASASALQRVAHHRQGRLPHRPRPEIHGKVIHRPPFMPGRAHGRVRLLAEEGSDHEGPRVHLDSPDQSLKIVMDPKTIMDPWRISHFRSDNVLEGLPGCRPVSGGHLGQLPARSARSRHSGANEYQRKLSFEITEVLAKCKSPKEALESAAKEWDKITERRGLDKQKAAWGEKLHEMKRSASSTTPLAAKAK